MKVRMKFQKYGAMKFIGHLDVMRYFQKAFRRAELDSEYTQGYNPHQVMSFASPLGLGLTSDGEYMDIGLKSSQSPEIMVKRINGLMSEGFRIIGYHILKEPGENEKIVTAMSLVSSSDYIVSLKDGYSLGDKITIEDEFRKAFLEFTNRSEIMINKKTKKSEKLVDIKPMISLVAFDVVEYKDKLEGLISGGSASIDKFQSYIEDAESVADTYDNGIKVYLQLDTGSVSNLKPELVMEAFCRHINIEYNPYAWQVHRLEMYTRDDKTYKLTSLDRLEK